MPKAKKTREQKILAETRRKQQVLTAQTPVYSVSDLESKNKSVVINSDKQQDFITENNATLKNQNYPFLIHDLRKTIFATVLIITIQLILHNFIK